MTMSLPEIVGSSSAPGQADRIYLSPPDVGPLEVAAVADAVRSGWVAPLGPNVDAFEAEMCRFIGAPDGSAAALSSGTAALQLALLLAGVSPGGRVVIPTMTFVASANAVLQVGAEPVFVDVDPSTWNLDVDLVLRYLEDRKAAGDLPDAVMLVDLYGTATDVTDIVAWCHEHEMAVIEDAAEAVGARYGARHAGRLGDFGVFSFNGNKIMTTSGGGMLVADPESVSRARWLAAQAREPGESYVHKEQGFNYRLSNVLAALGRAQLDRLPQMINRRREIRLRYEDVFANRYGFDLNPVPSVDEANCWLTVLQLNESVNPSTVIRDLDENGIEARRAWNPMHVQPLFETAQAIGGDVALGIFDTTVCLPSGSSLSDDDQDRIVDIVCATIDSELG